MSFENLSAAELARIDAVCLQYETDLRRGGSPSIDALVAQHGDANAEELRQELESVRDELAGLTDLDSNIGLSNSGTVTLPKIGSSIGPYRIEDTLGRGGMGVVFKALDQRLGRSVAIKMLAVEIMDRRDVNDRFQREARAVAGITHANIVELFDVGSDNGLPYAVMEYLHGETLDARLARKPLSIAEIRRFGGQIASALATAHSAGVVHRDLKPHNIMLVRRHGDSDSESDADSNSTIVKLFDFGLSRVPRVALDEDVEQTREGMILGTPGYMAPEQASGESVTPAADIFSLGCTLYEAFYGRLAFDGTTKAARLVSTINQLPTADAIRRRDDPGLADLIDECLQKDPRNRPAAADIAKQLALPESRSGISRRRSLILLATSAAGVLAGIPIAKYLLGSGQTQLPGIRSIAVLSFVDSATPTETRPSDTQSSTVPIGDKPLHRGEELAALLAYELSRMSKVRVPQFRPISAETPQQFRDWGQQLGVDALLTGTMQRLEFGNERFIEIRLKLISAETGNPIWTRVIQARTDDNLLKLSRLATEVAAVVGQTLTSTADNDVPPSAEVFRCLVDAETRADPDSPGGLTMALRCFESAHKKDPKFVDPLAGIALTSITLAGQSSSEQTPVLVRQARERAEQALARDPSSIDARLAMAMLDWQTLARYEQADRLLRELTMVAPNHWQVQHQYGLLQLALGRYADAEKSLREASLLNPMSMIVKVDRARAKWFAGDTQRAIDDAMYLINRFDNHVKARGLLIDIYETQNRFVEAAALDEWEPTAGEMSRSDYLSGRKERLSRLPYGPFGEQANDAIWQARTDAGIDEASLAKLLDPMPPMVPLLLAQHPTFVVARSLDRAAEILPSTKTAATKAP